MPAANTRSRVVASMSCCKPLVGSSRLLDEASAEESAAARFRRRVRLAGRAAGPADAVVLARSSFAPRRTSSLRESWARVRSLLCLRIGDPEPRHPQRRRHTQWPALASARTASSRECRWSRSDKHGIPRRRAQGDDLLPCLRPWARWTACRPTCRRRPEPRGRACWATLDTGRAGQLGTLPGLDGAHGRQVTPPLAA